MGLLLKIVGVLCLLTSFGNFMTGRLDNIPLGIICLLFGLFALFRGLIRD